MATVLMKCSVFAAVTVDSIRSAAAEPVKITPQFVDSIHQKGGTILSSSRGPVDIGRAVDNLIAREVNILFTVGGDGTQRGANDLYQEARKSRPSALGRGRAENDR